jgi:hypothetical protein
MEGGLILNLDIFGLSNSGDEINITNPSLIYHYASIFIDGYSFLGHMLSTTVPKGTTYFLPPKKTLMYIF